MRRRGAWIIAAVLLVPAAAWRVDAHKPITSPYTFSDDVLPILRDRCAACHVAGGVAPMALTTAEEAIPWGESIRLELIAGHMPPWSAMSGGKRLRHAEGMTARELNVLLTWVTGGTPPGEAKAVPVTDPSAEWPLGLPDATLALPEAAVSADQTEITREFVLPLDAALRRPLRAVDLRPGTRSIVRSARVAVRSASATPGSVERLVSLWVPGDQPVALPAGTAFAVPNDAELVVTLRLKKTWQHERQTMSDRSTLALYFAAPGASPVVLREAGHSPQPTALPTGVPVGAVMAGGVVGGETLPADTRVLAVYPTAAAPGSTVTIDAVPPGGVMQRLLEFKPQRGWERRYFLAEPIDLPKGTRLQTSVKFEQGPVQAGTGPIVILNTVPAR